MRQRLSAARRKLKGVSEKIEQAGVGEIASEISKLEVSTREERIDGLIAAWEEGDHDAAGRARNELVDLAKEIDRLDTLVDWPAKVTEFKTDSEEVREILVELGGPDLETALETVVAEGERAIDAHDPKMLDASITTLNQIRIAALQRDPRFWAGMLQFCASRVADFPDQVKAREMLAEGASAMRRGDSGSLQSICRQLFQELPQEIAAEAQAAAIRSDVTH